MIFITQPTYMPWIGYFAYILKSKKVIFLDDVQFARRSWQQRNKIFKKNSFQYLTVPVKKKGLYHQMLSEVEVQDKNFFKDHMKLIEQTYCKSKYFEIIYSELLKLKAFIENNNKLISINIEIIRKILEIINIKLDFNQSSDFKLSGKKSYKLINICNHLKQKDLLCNKGAKEYIEKDIDLFKSNKINLFIYNYKPLKYNQHGKDFIPNLSIIDLLFNEGPNCLDFISSGLDKIN